MPNSNGQIRVLAISGGGIRGIIPAKILTEIEAMAKKPIWQLFDLICGTSTGGILSAALTKPEPLKASECLSLYLGQGNAIFPKSKWRALKTLGGVTGPEYDGIGLRSVLSKTFRNALLESALTPTFVTAYAIERRAPIFLKSWVPLGMGTPLVEACMATSAGPTFFPPAKCRDEWYWDGGMVNNNPSLSGVIEACMKYGVHTRDCVVLSLGTGVCAEPIPHDKAAGWGKLSLVRPIIDVALDGVSDLTHYQMTDLMPDANYLHLQCALPSSAAAMDDASPANCANLVLCAQNLLASNREALLALLARL